MDFVKKYNTVKKRPSLSTWSLLWCIMYIITWKVCYGYTIVHSHHCNLTNRIIALTINHDNHIIASHNAAFLRVFSQASYHLLSPQDVSILNHAYIQITKATVAKIPSIQFMVDLMVSSKEDDGHSSVFITCLIPGTNLYISSQNHALACCGIVHIVTTTNHNVNVNLLIIFLMVTKYL
jgi:hypothetical protein